MKAIYRRELRAFFTNPIGYVVLAVLFCISGFFFFSFNLAGGSADLAPLYSSLFTVVLLALPFLTMRLFSEEKRQKTDQALLTAPTGLTGIVLGKFFATLTLYVIGLSITLIYAFVIALQTTPDWMMVIGNFLGLTLVGGLIIAIGVFISSLTESQIIAAIGTLAVSLLLMSVDLLSALFTNVAWMSKVTTFLSVAGRFADFTAGLIYYDNILFFLSAQALFIFLTVRVLDSKRWN